MTNRSDVLAKTNGNCGYCGGNLAGKSWHVDHIQPLRRGNDKHPKDNAFENLMAACPRCNRWKATNSVQGFRSEIQKQVERVRRDSAGFRLAEDFGLVKAEPTPVVFYFEQLVPTPPMTVASIECCEACRKQVMEGSTEFFLHIRMIVCPNCGNKRCPKATDHRHKCTRSNAVGQTAEFEDSNSTIYPLNYLRIES